MDFLIIMVVVFLVASIVNYTSTNTATIESSSIRERSCPPHKWRHEEIKDHEGTVHGWKLVCDICGPLKAQELVDREKF